MRIRSPSLPELHAFVAVVETGGFSRAASRLAVTQGAVSRSVLRLEARLALPLFERAPSGVRPTAAGQRYYERVQPALAALEAAVPTPARTAAPTVLRVSAISSLNMRWLVPRLPSLYAAHPQLQLVFTPYHKDDAMQRDDVDCYIETRATASSRWPRHVQATYIVGRDIVPICHPGAAPRIRTPQDLLRFPLLHHGSYPGNWALWLSQQGVDTRSLPLAAGFDLAAALIEAVVAGMGVAVVQRCLIERELAEGRLVVPLDHAVSTGRGYHLCVPRARADEPAIEAFRRWLLAQAAPALRAPRPPRARASSA
jgi:DNA-binding transcriptional LysR family regulator